MAAAVSSPPLQALVSRSLYRSILRASKPFTFPPNAVVLTCLLHRLGGDDEEFSSLWHNDSNDVRPTFPNSSASSLFKRLLDEVISGNSLGFRQMSFPSQVDTTRLRSVVRREFRCGPESLSRLADVPSRRQAAFSALRELNKKLAWSEKLLLQVSLRAPDPPLPVRGFRSLPCNSLSSSLRPGCFLIAHPHLSGFFRRSVILLLDHNEVEDSTSRTGYGSYGVIVNRPAVSPIDPYRRLQLNEVLHPLPSVIENVFSSSYVREGGPVHMSLQILTAASSEQHDECHIGGQLLSSQPNSVSEDLSIIAKTGKAVYYGGDLVRIASATQQGKLDCHDTVFFVGASSWEAGQLESEVNRGCWLPCEGPVEAVFTGTCEQQDDLTSAAPSQDPNADYLWLSMLSACGPNEAAFANLMLEDDGDDELGVPCDVVD